MPATTCPNCGHSETHSPLSGCLWAAGEDYCTCTSDWGPAPTLADAVAARDAALERVTIGTDPAWGAAAADAVAVLAHRPEPFTSDDVWDLLAERGAPECRERRALGPILQAAIREGLVEPVGYAPSRRRHAAPVRVYTGDPTL